MEHSILKYITVISCLFMTIKALECEVGRNKPTYHTSYYTSNEHPSNMSVDEDLYTYSYSHGYNRTTWLRIDLGQEYNIKRIVLSNIYFTSTFESQYLRRFNIEVSNREVSPLDNTESYYMTTTDNFIPLSLTIRKTKRGRYVHVYKKGNDYYKEPLTIAEINIYAEFTSLQTGYECEVASNKSASQISTSGGLEAKYAIDDKLDLYSRTDSSSNNINTWLQVDLFQNYLVVKVVVSNVNYNLKDYIYLRNFAIFVRQTNETTDKVGNAFGSTAEWIIAYDANPASPSIVFIKLDGEIGRFVTVVKQGPTFMEPLVIADLAVFTNIGASLTTTNVNIPSFNSSIFFPTPTTTSLFITTSPSNDKKTIPVGDIDMSTKSKDNTGIIIGCVVGIIILILLILIIICVIIRCKRKPTGLPKPNINLSRISNILKRKRSTNIERQSIQYTNPTIEANQSISTEDKIILSINKQRLRSESEFKKLPAEDIKKCTVACSPLNREKNRFKNIYPFDDNLVPLKIYEGDDKNDNFINASFIKGFREVERKYIATQGPITGTIGDMWRLVWQYDITTIVMLTQLTENTSRKKKKVPTATLR